MFAFVYKDGTKSFIMSTSRRSLIFETYKQAVDELVKMQNDYIGLPDSYEMLCKAVVKEIDVCVM